MNLWVCTLLRSILLFPNYFVWIAVNSLLLLCFLLSVGNSRTLHSHLNFLDGLQEPFLRLTNTLRKVLSNMSVELWSDTEELCLTFSSRVKDAHRVGLCSLCPACRDYCSFFCVCVCVWKECSGRSPTACGGAAEPPGTPSVTQPRSPTGGRRSATSGTARPGKPWGSGGGK